MPYTPETRAALDAARASGLEIGLRRVGSFDAFSVLSPAVCYGEQKRIRFKGWRATDPTILERRSLMRSIQVEYLPQGEDAWRPFPRQGCLSGTLVDLWLDPMIAFLHHGDPEAIAEERSHKDRWKSRRYADARVSHSGRQDDRIHGLPDYGDLCVSERPVFGAAHRYHIFRLLSPAHPRSALKRLETLGHPDDVQDVYDLVRAFHVTPFIRKLGPLSLKTLPQGILSAHDRLMLTSYQERIDTIRTRRPITPEDLRPLHLSWSVPATS